MARDILFGDGAFAVPGEGRGTPTGCQETALPDEILYCARCHRVILPREVEGGQHHFVDGDPVCGECFTRLSRRLQPIIGRHAEADVRPIPVDLADLEKELSKGTEGTQQFTPVPVRDRPPAPVRKGARRSYSPAQVAFMCLCLLLGLAAGGLAYHAGMFRESAGPPGLPPGLPGGRDRQKPDRSPAAGARAAQPRVPTAEPPDGTLRIAAEADAAVHMRTEHHLGASPRLKLERDSRGTVGEAYLRFDISPAHKPFSRAELQFTVEPLSRSAAVEGEILLVPDCEWNELGINWTEHPSTGGQAARWKLPAGDQRLRIDFTRALRAAAESGARRLSLCIRLAPAPGERAEALLLLHSRESPSGAGPVLRLWPTVAADGLAAPGGTMQPKGTTATEALPGRSRSPAAERP
jgi:hypothetical protein